MANDPINAALFEIQRGVSESGGGGKFDVHYKAGKGALVVPAGSELKPDNVVLAVPEFARGGAA